MLLIVFIFFVKIVFLSCIFENKNEQNLFDEINRQRKNFGLSNVEIHLTLQLAAEKRCSNQEQLIETYQRMLSNTYRDDDWPRQEQLDKIFSHVNERIYLNGINIHNDIFHKFHLIPNTYQRNFIYLGISLHEYKNFSAQCIIYGELNNSISNHRRLIRLLYILIGCGIFLLSLIVCSIMNDQRQIKLKQQLEQQEIIDNRHTIVPKNSMNVLTDNDRGSSSLRRTDINRITMAQLGSTVDERPSAVHSFFSKS
ncbi:unnamed protein product [Rotaria sordida]|uniref:Uncharacterized protein n=1 Tax=Rotaria sordida TaxID=392033 RepID=A0A813ZZF7_9BILA|nr:unnamed protein product [Rotaria sordida]CAF0907046.1 unnamed protein product [Rotaria sordida]CAF0944991.1 unnamed protein product [Rotaria sordida]CAF3553615.1 unnamed protein product [Rotaria sordida]CAF3858223.1 unnamed protein product [Rotaria sordida]